MLISILKFLEVMINDLPRLPHVKSMEALPPRLPPILEESKTKAHSQALETIQDHILKDVYLMSKPEPRTHLQSIMAFGLIVSIRLQCSKIALETIR